MWNFKICKKVAEDFLGCPVSKAVVTVPAHFKNSQKLATSNSVQLSDLDLELLLNEPTSASLAFHYSSSGSFEEDEKKIYLVFDFGGGTLDLTIVEIESDETKILAIQGDSFLGGEDFDISIFNYFLSQFSNFYFNENEKIILKQISKSTKRKIIIFKSSWSKISFFNW